jgi:hypothetical protein
VVQALPTWGGTLVVLIKLAALVVVLLMGARQLSGS